MFFIFTLHFLLVMLEFFQFSNVQDTNSSVIKSKPGLSSDHVSPGNLSNKTKLPSYHHYSHPTISWDLQQQLKKWQPEFLGHGLQIACSPNRDTEFSMLTCIDAQCPMQMQWPVSSRFFSNRREGAPLMQSGSPQPHFRTCSHHTNRFCPCIYGLYQPHMMERCQENGVAMNTLPGIEWQSSTTGSGQRVGRPWQHWVVSATTAMAPCSSSSKDTNWTAETIWAQITWSGTYLQQSSPK